MEKETIKRLEDFFHSYSSGSKCFKISCCGYFIRCLYCGIFSIL